jgi:hypothetical protein
MKSAFNNILTLTKTFFFKFLGVHREADLEHAGLHGLPLVEDKCPNTNEEKVVFQA